MPHRPNQQRTLSDKIWFLRRPIQFLLDVTVLSAAFILAYLPAINIQLGDFYIDAAIRQIPLVIRSEGYGSCRIFATGLRHVWAVQYLNSMGKIILDTMEVGGIPASACAAREDFEDSAGRLAEILEAYDA